jgi:hypothetical protein
MGYLHIDNLYKNVEVLLFKECYALEKIHGTSAHISWKDKKVILFSGGEKYANFIKLFDVDALEEKFKELFEYDVTIFGEAYGGKCQGMSDTYGKELKFVAFDVKVGDHWLDVPNAEEVVKKFGLEFVDYHKISTDLKAVDAERDRPSTQAIRNGCGDNKMREGVVLRPLIEVTKNNGSRVIVKHKGDGFSETRTKRKVDPDRLVVLKEAQAIAEEWVTPMRLTHVLDKLDNPTEIQDTGKVIKAMIEDVIRESKGEIIESKEATHAIGRLSAQLYKKRISKVEE